MEPSLYPKWLNHLLSGTHACVTETKLGQNDWEEHNFFFSTPDGYKLDLGFFQRDDGTEGYEYFYCFRSPNKPQSTYDDNPINIPIPYEITRRILGEKA